nr:immunoglobulin light chain junction region [Macaca mulatta]
CGAWDSSPSVGIF